MTHFWGVIFWMNLIFVGLDVVKGEVGLSTVFSVVAAAAALWLHLRAWKTANQKVDP